MSREQGVVHVVGAGPVGLFMTALLQSIDGQSIRLYEQRDVYTRTRMVSLAPYLIADSIESYKADTIDGQDVEAIFEPAELEGTLDFRRNMAPDLRERLEEWVQGFVPLNTIEMSLRQLVEQRDTGTVELIPEVVDAESALSMMEPGDVLVDCTGARSLMRDLLLPGEDLDVRGRNTLRFRLEHALVVTFLYGQNYACNEYCKYYKNIENPGYKFIPAVQRTYYDGAISHVTGIVSISRDEYEQMPVSCDGSYLRENFPSVAQSMDRFIDNVKAETNGELVGDLDVLRIPLDLYRARNATSRLWYESGIDHPLARTPVFLLGDSAIGSPYFQSISLGLESAFYLAAEIRDRELTPRQMFDRYESFQYKQWMRVYMRTQMIKHNKDLLESVDDTMGLLSKLHIF
jgi:2-polyprenyl-6-methoxyphenol hydroxylase-like FAD-dependent oxidoreductase